MTGPLVAVEGPNGVGKTTVVTLLGELLRERTGAEVHLTTEPSDTPLGRLVRSAEATLTGRALALAIAADRYVHIGSEIVPRIETGCYVVSDRYVQSSLVLQRIDGLSLEEIWTYNAYVLPPTVSFYLTEGAGVIGKRLADRSGPSRLESLGSPERELALYRQAFVFLAQFGWRQIEVDCHGQAAESVAAVLLDHLEQPREAS